MKRRCRSHLLAVMSQQTSRQSSPAESSLQYTDWHGSIFFQTSFTANFRAQNVLEEAFLTTSKFILFRLVLTLEKCHYKSINFCAPPPFFLIKKIQYLNSLNIHEVMVQLWAVHFLHNVIIHIRSRSNYSRICIGDNCRIRPELDPQHCWNTWQMKSL